MTMHGLVLAGSVVFVLPIIKYKIGYMEHGCCRDGRLCHGTTLCSQVKCMMNQVMGPYVSIMLYLNRSTCFEDFN